ncbi:hypothetical protein CBL_05119 [Carabus blaptoides fortunei]
MDTNRRRIKKNIFGESNIDEIFNGSDDMRINTFNIIIDRLSNELGRRQKSYGELEERFGVLNKLEYLENDKTVLLKNVGKEIKTKAKEKLENIRKNNLISTYPNLDIALRIFLCIPATNCSGERSFSTLKRIKNYYRSTLGQEKLNSLAILFETAEPFFANDSGSEENIVEEQEESSGTEQDAVSSDEEDMKMKR